MEEETTVIPDIDDRLAESGLEVKTENPKKKRKKKGKGKNNPRRPSKKQPIDSRPRGPEEVEEPATVSEDEEEEFVPDGDIYDDYLNNQVMLKTGDRRLKCAVVNQTQDLKNVPIGQQNNNPLLGTRIYDLQLPDGQIEQHTANTIVECIYSNIDKECHTFTMMNELLNHKKDDTALTKDEATYFTKVRTIAKETNHKGLAN